MDIIKHGKFSATKASLKGTYENVRKKFPKLREDLLKGAWEIANKGEDKKKSNG